MVDSGRSDCVNILKGYCFSSRNLDSSFNVGKEEDCLKNLIFCSSVGGGYSIMEFGRLVKG